MADVNVAILGLARLGVSFGLALKRYMKRQDAAHTFTVTGYDERGYHGKKAREMGAVDSLARSADSAVSGAHIVLLTLPYHQVEQTYHLIGPRLAPGAVVLDASPLKQPSIGWAAQTFPQQPESAAYLVGITPVLNPEVLLDPSVEVEDARADLFDRGTLVLTPGPGCPAEAVELATEFARIVGASVHFMDVAEHDGLIAGMEGLPALLSLGLFRMLSLAEAWGDLRRLANPSFGVMTQHLRNWHPDALWALLHYNRQNTARYLAALINTLQELHGSLAEDEEGLQLEAALGQSAARYEEWEQQRFSNVWEKEQDVSMPGGGFLSMVGGAVLGQRVSKDKEEKDKDARKKKSR